MTVHLRYKSVRNTLSHPIGSRDRSSCVPQRHFPVFQVKGSSHSCTAKLLAKYLLGVRVGLVFLKRIPFFASLKTTARKNVLQESQLYTTGSEGLDADKLLQRDINRLK